MFIETEERITAAYIFYSWTKNNSNNRYTSIKFEQFELAKSRAMRPCMPTWSMCQRGLRTNVLACQGGLRANVAKVYQLLVFTFQRVIRLAIFFILACQHGNKGRKFIKHSCYQVWRKIFNLYYYIKNSTFYSIS